MDVQWELTSRSTCLFCIDFSALLSFKRKRQRRCRIKRKISQSTEATAEGDNDGAQMVVGVGTPLCLGEETDEEVKVNEISFVDDNHTMLMNPFLHLLVHYSAIITIEEDILFLFLHAYMVTGDVKTGVTD